MDIDEKLGEVPDLISQTEMIVEHLRCAETSENEKDFEFNVDEAIASVDALRKALVDLRNAR